MDLFLSLYPKPPGEAAKEYFSMLLYGGITWSGIDSLALKKFQMEVAGWKLA